MIDIYVFLLKHDTIATILVSKESVYFLLTYETSDITYSALAKCYHFTKLNNLSFR